MTHGSPDRFPAALHWAIRAALDKKAEDVLVLDLTPLGAFTEYFLICSGSSGRQVQAISDAVEEKLARGGSLHARPEGYLTAEWVLLDYGDFIAHIFSQRARLYYDLERLWRAARRIEFSDRPSEVAEK